MNLLGRRKPEPSPETLTTKGEDLSFAPNGAGRPMGVYQGRIPNPHVLYGQDDMTNAPTTFARIATRWGDVQLSNGWDRTNYGQRLVYHGSGYLNVVQPNWPGQTRQFGQHGADFPMRGAAPSQWDQYVAATSGAQPDYPGGPGQAMGTIYNPGSGA